MFYNINFILLDGAKELGLIRYLGKALFNFSISNHYIYFIYLKYNPSQDRKISK